MSEPAISWLKFAELLRWRYSYLLNRELALQMAEDARDFVRAESGGPANETQ